MPTCLSPFWNFVRTALVQDETLTAADRDLAWTSLSRIERVGTPTEFEKLSLTRREDHRAGRVFVGCSASTELWAPALPGARRAPYNGLLREFWRKARSPDRESAKSPI